MWEAAKNFMGLGKKMVGGSLGARGYINSMFWASELGGLASSSAYAYSRGDDWTVGGLLAADFAGSVAGAGMAVGGLRAVRSGISAYRANRVAGMTPSFSNVARQAGRMFAGGALFDAAGSAGLFGAALASNRALNQIPSLKHAGSKLAAAGFNLQGRLAGVLGTQGSHPLSGLLGRLNSPAARTVGQRYAKKALKRTMNNW